MWVHYVINLNSMSSQGCLPHPSPAPSPSYYTNVEIWKLLNNMQDQLSFFRLNLYIALKSPTPCRVIPVLHSDMKNISLCRINMGGEWWGAKEIRCQGECSSHHQSVWLTDHYLDTSKFSSGKRTPQLFMAQILLEWHLWFIYEEVIM